MDSTDAVAEQTSSSRPAFQLRMGEIYWRVFAVVFLALEITKWFRVQVRIPLRPRVGMPPPRVRRVLHMLYHTPSIVFRAMLAAAIIAVVSDLVFRLLIRPLMVRWYNPRSPDPELAHPLPFFLKAGERTLAEVGARQVIGRRQLPGMLCRTNWGLYFYPFAWDQEPWSLPEAHLARVTTRTPRRRVLGWVEGYPDHVVFIDDAGEESAFVVADPAAVLGWFRTDRVPDGNSTLLTVGLSEPPDSRS